MPFSTLQLLWPFGLRRCQPVVSLPLKSGRKSFLESAARTHKAKPRTAASVNDVFIRSFVSVEASDERPLPKIQFDSCPGFCEIDFLKTSFHKPASSRP